jgi:hypothetical protein
MTNVPQLLGACCTAQQADVEQKGGPPAAEGRLRGPPLNLSVG